MGLFGSSGIRGPYGQRITAAFATEVGLALGTQRRRIELGWDVRTTSPLLANAFAAGALASGADVEQVGMVPTPTLAFAARSRDAGMMVTASHNPPNDNGFKFWNPDGSSFSPQEAGQMEELLARKAWKLSAWNTVRPLRTRSDAERCHGEAIQREVGDLEGLAVAVDPGGGAASRFSPNLFQSLGARVVALNASPDPRMAARESEPSESSLRLLAQTVVATGANLGLAHDGDADRVAVLDERGQWVPAEHVLILLARHLKARALAVPVNASLVLRDALPGVEIRFTPVGDVHISDALKTHRLDLGGEPSGTYVLPRWSLCPDGPYVGALVARLVHEAGSISALLGDVPRYTNLSAKVPVAEAAKASVMAKVAEDVRGLRANVNDLDGVRADFDDGWLLIRPSGTEPVVRVTAESRSATRARELLEKGKAIAVNRAHREVER